MSILVELGNPSPQVCRIVIDEATKLPVGHVHDPVDRDGDSITRIALQGEPTCAPGANAHELGSHLAMAGDVTQLPDHEAFVAVAHVREGFVAHMFRQPPTWVRCWSRDQPDEAAALEGYLAEFYGCPQGKPDEAETTHWSRSGPPGVAPEVAPEPEPEVTP